MKRSIPTLLLAAGCVAPPTRDVLTWRVVDLTHTISASIPLFPGSEPLRHEVATTIEANGYFSARFTMGEHTGTHVDAPAHFAPGKLTVEQILPASLIGEAAVLDVTARVLANPDHALTLDDVFAWESQHGELTRRHMVLVRTGWGRRWPDDARYRNADAQGTMHFPGVSVAASRFIASRGVRCIGIDTLSTDPGPSQDFGQHKQFLSIGGFHLENLANLEELPAAGAILIVAPLPLESGSGSPARVLALVPPGH
jgi:kynurenine formamidase